MIEIIIKERFKSIQPCSFILPEFSVLTGLNGSGKSHILEAISDTTKNEILINGKPVKNILYIPFNGLNSKIEENCDPAAITSFVKDFFHQFQQARSNPLFKRTLTIESLLQSIYDQNKRRVARIFLDKINIPLIDVTENYIFDIFDISMMPNDDFFTGQFALIFKNYHKRLEENRYHNYCKNLGYSDIPETLSDEQFEQMYGIPPWDFVNDILNTINVPYKVNSPLGSSKEATYNFQLKSIDEAFHISPQDLSTGEKVLISLALAIYNSSGTKNKPELLLIDEPDAPLHPSMSKKMVDILRDKIVKLSGIPVIIASHSPTTVICCDSSSVYKMERGYSSPIKASIQEMIGILTSDIPFLKISNDKRRQVFVESKNDVNYFELITNILNRIKRIDLQLVFLPAKTSSGSNCTDVINLVDSLFINGNDQVYGIIDWDLQNESSDRVIILGEKDRYSIENYILDPLLMGLFFLREGKLTYSEIDLSQFGINSYPELQKLKNSECQIIIDFVLNKLELSGLERKEYLTYGGYKLSLNSEFNKTQGHQIEKLYKEKFPFLKSYNRESQLKLEVINKVFSDFPMFVPKELYNTILKIK